MFHNLRGYDGHFIIREISNFGEKINDLPKDIEKCKAFLIGRKRVFINSIRFMNSSSESLTENLRKDKFHYLSQKIQENQPELVKKTIWIYEYLWKI